MASRSTTLARTWPLLLLLAAAPASAGELVRRAEAACAQARELRLDGRTAEARSAWRETVALLREHARARPESAPAVERLLRREWASLAALQPRRWPVERAPGASPHWPELDPVASGYASRWAALPPIFLQSSLERGELLLWLAGELETAGLPRELAALAVIESALDPQALSSAGALGCWQLMPATARRLGLTVRRGRDERRDVAASTAAAIRYLHELWRRFGDWELVLAAYNCGEGRVERALSRVGASSFRELAAARALPAETLAHVPKVLAASRLLPLGAPGSPPDGDPTG